MSTLTGKCPHCSSEQMTFNSVAEYTHTKRPETFYVLFRCAGCDGAIVANVIRSTGGETPHTFKPDVRTHPRFTVVGVLPKPANKTAPDATPDNVARYYVQAVEAAGRKHWDAAGAMCRKALETAVRILDPAAPKGLNLKGRINRLGAAHAITPAMNEWAHIIRDDGNDAVHDENPYGEEDAGQLLAFSETFLMYAFTLPAMIKDRKTRKGE